MARLSWTLQIVAYDFGCKSNILRRLTSFGCRVTVVPASYPADKVMEMNPDGVFLSNGPVCVHAMGVPHWHRVCCLAADALYFCPLRNLCLDTASCSHYLQAAQGVDFLALPAPPCPSFCLQRCLHECAHQL